MSDVKITEFIEFCNTRIKFHSRRAEALKIKDSRASSLHSQTSQSHEELVNWFTDYLEDPPITRKSIDDLFSLNPLELDALDEDVREELSVSTSDVNDAQIIELLELADRSLDLNEIILGCYRKYAIKHKRIQLTARIHRMVNKGEVKVVGKGRYALPSLHDEELNQNAQNGELGEIPNDM